MQEENETIVSLSEAAKIAKVGYTALYVAMQKGRLPAQRNKRWMVSLKDLKEYRATKFSRSKKTFQGERIHDLDEGKWSVLYAAKTLSAMLGKQIREIKIYQLIYSGALPAKKFGGAWVLKKEDVETLYQVLKEKQESE